MNEIDCTTGIGNIFAMVDLRNHNERLMMLYGGHWHPVDVEKNLRRRNPEPKPHEKKLLNALWSVAIYRRYSGTRIFGIEIPEICYSYYWVIGENEKSIIAAQISKVRMLGIEKEHMSFDKYQASLREIGRSLCGDKFISAVRDL